MYKKGDKVKLLTNNASIAHHPSEERLLEKGDIIQIYKFEDDIIYFLVSIHARTPYMQQINLICDEVELVQSDVIESPVQNNCNCSIRQLMCSGCNCGGR